MDESSPQSSSNRDEVLTPSSSSESIRRHEPRYVVRGHSPQKARGSAAKSSERRPSHSPKPETEDIASRSSAEAPGYVSTDESSLTPLIVAEGSPPGAKSSAPRKVHGTLRKANATPATQGEKRSDVLEKANVARSGSTAMTCGRERRIYAEEREKSKRSVFSRTGRHLLARGRRTTGNSFAGRQASIPSRFEDIEGQRIFDADAAYPKSSLFGRLSTGIGSIARRLFRSGPPGALPTTVVRGKGKRTELGLLTSRSGEARTLRGQSEGAPFGEEGRVQGSRLKRTRHSRRNDVDDTIQGSEQDLQPLYHAARSSHRHDRRSPIRRATETVVGGDGVSLSAACIAASDNAKRVALETSGVRRPVPEGQGDIQLQDNRGTCAMPKTRTSRFDPMVLIAAGENLRRKRKEESTRSHRRRHRSKERDERTKSKSSGSRGRGESNGEGEHRRKRKSRSRKRHRDGSRSSKEKSETNVAGSTYELSGSPSRSFDFSISPVPVTRGTLPRPELTRSSEAQLGSSTWLVDGNSSDSPQAVAPDMMSSLRKPFAPPRKEKKREVNVISASSQLSNKKSKRSSKRSSKKKKTSRPVKEAEKEEPNQLPAVGEVSPPSGQESGATSPQQMSEPRSKHKSKSKSKSKRKSRENKGREAGKDGEKSPNDKEKRKKSKRKSREDKKSKADESPGEESPNGREERKSKRKSRKDKETNAHKGATEESPPERKERKSKRKSRKDKETKAEKNSREESPQDREERKSKRRSKGSKGKKSPGRSGNTSPQDAGERKKRGRHGKNDRSRKHQKHRKHRKKHSPKAAPENGTTNSYFFQWNTADVPSVAGIHRDLIFSTREMEDHSPIWSPGSETVTLPFSSLSTSTLPDKRRPDSGRRGKKSDQRATSRRSKRSSKRSKHDRHRRSRRGHGHRSHKSRERATSPGSPPSGEISPAESRNRSRPTSPAALAGDVSPASPPGRISPAGLKSPSSETPTSQESSLSPESSRKKSRHHRHGKKHRRKKHKRRGSPRHKSRSRASKRSRSKHRRSKSSRSRKGKDRSPRSGEISSVTPESTVSGGSKRQERSGSRRSRSRSRSRSHRSGRSSHGSKRKSRSKDRSLSPERSRERSTETSTKSPETSREDKIGRKRSRTWTKSRSRHSSRSRSSRKSRSRSRESKSRSRSRSEGSRRSRSKRSRESESISSSSPHRTTSDIRKHKGKKRHHRHRHRKGRGRSSHRKSRLNMTSGAGRGRKKRGDTVTESYAAQSSPPYLCLLLSSVGVVLTMVTCVILIYYVITCRKQLMATSHSVFSGATQPEYPDPEHEPIAPEVVPGTPEAMQVYYCTTDHCKREARYIGRLLSQRERPCDNFYKHVCNVWMSEHPAHALSTGSVVSRDTLLQDNIARQLVAVVGSARQRDIKVAANLYKVCADRGRSAARSKEAIGALFSRWKIVKWPRTGAVEDVMAVWTFAAELNRDLNLATLVRAGVGTDPDNVDATAIELSQPRCLYARVGKDNKEAEDLLIAAVREAATEIGDSGPATDALGGQLWSACTLIAAACRSGYGDDSVSVVKFGQLKHLGLQTFLTVLLHGGIGSADNVVLHSVRSLLRELQGVLHTVPPLDALNYLGFLAIVHVAPFLPDELRGLRYLFTEARLGRTVGDANGDTPLLCARLVERALPGCFAKAAHIWRLSNGQEMSTREWLTQLESVFLRHVADFPWMSELSSLLIRYRVKRRALTQFGQSLGERRDDACAPLDDQMGVGDPLLFFANVSRRRQAQKFRELRGDSALLRRRAAGSEFSTEASFRRSLRVVHVPAALFNASVESNSSFFVFHLARVAVRFYRALVQLLHEDPYERDVPASFTDDSRAKLDALLDCFDGDAQSSLGASSTSPDALSQLRRAFLDGTSALLLAMKAFEELPPVRQIWKLDLRLAGLENSSAKQLFFIYFALDNCESTAPAFHKSSMSAEDKVNVPLKHIKQFAEAFHCKAQDPMASARHGSCSVMRGVRHEQPTQRREYRKPDGSSPSGV
ncbi:uncharacterized protein LOC142559218 [Dermacentor variabilis]|uniref:uncharacterized protein LOC142559218 n=1 Tax=Dermacentor variabilis TaxID=34621 RepID=UPI003F5AF068